MYKIYYIRVKLIFFHDFFVFKLAKLIGFLFKLKCVHIYTFDSYQRDNKRVVDINKTVE